jgi:hypothetical protein
MAIRLSRRRERQGNRFNIIWLTEQSRFTDRKDFLKNMRQEYRINTVVLFIIEVSILVALGGVQPIHLIYLA